MLDQRIIVQQPESPPNFKNFVSVITTFFNAEKFLAEAVESVLAQRNFDCWELILVNDGSIDSSPLIAQSFARDFKNKIRYFGHPENANLGISASRNLGLLHALGEFVAFLDADDVWLEDKLSEQVQLLAQHKKAAMVYGAAERWFDWQNDSPQTSTDLAAPVPNVNFIVPARLPGVGTNVLLAPPQLLNAFLIDESLTPCTCAAIIRSDALRSVGGLSDEFAGLYDDQVLYAKLAVRFPIYVADKCWARYRQHADSCCATARSDGTEKAERLKFLRWLENYLSAPGANALANESLRQTLEAEILKVSV